VPQKGSGTGRQYTGDRFGIIRSGEGYKDESPRGGGGGGGGIQGGKVPMSMGGGGTALKRDK